MAFDSDGSTLYYKGSVVSNVPVDKTGTIQFGKMEVIPSILDVNTMRSLSVSNGYAVLKQQTSTGFKYFVQKFTSDEKPKCFAEAKENDMRLKLFVSP
uniref:Lipoprotein n=1 Tax=Steinernema glaseri TaxID=37863 RepID=A0A1I8A108_9BILA